MAKKKEGTLIRGNVNGASFLIVVQSTPNFSPVLIVTAKTKEMSTTVYPIICLTILKPGAKKLH